MSGIAKKKIMTSSKVETNYKLTVYQVMDLDTGKVLELCSIVLNENDEQKNIDFVKSCKGSPKSDGLIYGIITEQIEVPIFDYHGRKCWKIDPNEYDRMGRQYCYGMEIVDPKTGERTYEGDDGGGWGAVMWEDNPEVYENTEEIRPEDNQLQIDKLHSMLKPETQAKLQKFSEQRTLPKTNKRILEKPIKGCIVPIRFSEQELIKIDELVTLASENMGIDVGRSWVIRELIKIGTESFVKRFKE